MVKYKYDAWGNCIVQNVSEEAIASDLGNRNPFRYRGYYYSDDLGLYYLKSRFYDPEVGRFISADSIDYLAPDTVNGLNLYAYCNNNPVMNMDPSGHSFSTVLVGLGILFLVTWVAGEIFGHQLVGGIESVAGGGTAITTGISLFSFGPVGWVIGGIAIVAGVASIAFGTAEIQEHYTGNNWIQDSFGWNDSVYNGLYFSSSIIASLASIGGNIYRNSRITSGTSRAGKTGKPYSRYYQTENGKVKSITHYGKGGNRKYRIDIYGHTHFIKRIQKEATLHIHPFGVHNGYVKEEDPDIIRCFLWLISGNWR